MASTEPEVRDLGAHWRRRPKLSCNLMLSYQHIYHAGNHADVLKHVVFVLLLQALQRKATPVRVFDAHAGSGRYDLGSAEARKTGEASAGIARVLAAREPPAALAPYLAAVRALNVEGRLSCYPGSPLLAAGLLRARDHLTVLEMHPQAVAALRGEFRNERRVHVVAGDSYANLPGLVPPPERRGMVLIDPSYERKDEYRKTLQLLRAAHRRWPTGVYVVWYPVIARPDAARFPQAAARTGIAKLWRFEVRVLSDDHPGMRGSGLLIVNLPWGLEPVLADILPWVWRTLSEDGAGGWQSQCLVPERPP